MAARSQQLHEIAYMKRYAASAALHWSIRAERDTNARVMLYDVEWMRRSAIKFEGTHQGCDTKFEHGHVLICTATMDCMYELDSVRDRDVVHSPSCDAYREVVSWLMTPEQP